MATHTISAVVKNTDARLIGLVSTIWGGFAVTYWALGMRTSAMTWGAGACVFFIFAVAMTLARARTASTKDTVEALPRAPRHGDTVFLATVSAVWTVFALVYAWLGMSISAVTWAAGAWLFLLLTAGLVAARRRRGPRARV